MADESKSAAEKILVLVDNVLDILAPIAVGVPPFNIIIPAVKVMLPIIASLFGIVLPPITQALRLAEATYAPLNEQEARLVLAEYGQ